MTAVDCRIPEKSQASPGFYGVRHRRAEHAVADCIAPLQIRIRPPRVSGGAVDLDQPGQWRLEICVRGELVLGHFVEPLQKKLLGAYKIPKLLREGGVRAKRVTRRNGSILGSKSGRGSDRMRECKHRRNRSMSCSRMCAPALLMDPLGRFSSIPLAAARAHGKPTKSHVRSALACIVTGQRRS